MDICLVCLPWCFAVGEVGHVSSDCHPPTPGGRGGCPSRASEAPGPKRREGRSSQPRKKGKKPVQALAPPRGEPEHPVSTKEKYEGPGSSKDWPADPEGRMNRDLSGVIDLMWARDGERWEAWEQQHHPASLLEIAAMGTQLPGCRARRGLAISSPNGRRQ
ncbi:UNVERIFIED_CONTAM: hypothetical protein FKN15_043986 [Acipenser sinensis]